MPAFIDARCQQCGRRIGWFGEYKDRPRCRCGHLPGEVKVKKEPETTPERVAGGNELRDLRIAAGLSLVEPAKEFGLDVLTLSRWERGLAKISDHVKAQLVEYYREATKGD